MTGSAYSITSSARARIDGGEFDNSMKREMLI
jgi:hypothetical protein